MPNILPEVFDLVQTRPFLSLTSVTVISLYNYQDPIIMAFSHTHLVGAGVNDLGHFGVTPFRKTEKNSPAYDEGPWESLNIDKTIKSRLWWSEYNKSTEYARPGLYGKFERSGC